MDLYLGNLMLPSLKKESSARQQLCSISRVYVEAGQRSGEQSVFLTSVNKNKLFGSILHTVETRENWRCLGYCWINCGKLRCLGRILYQR